MTDLDDYVDVREIHPEFTTIPCMVCDNPFYVSQRFAYNHETWYCDNCLPEGLWEVRDDMTIVNTVQL